ncbi:hypothetical protein [Stieleria varia]|uniref:Uncharacterized protein n=1 Tax=Stieleria varia TaxID=2528005 RepID=A0A5C6AUH6_9BACT|nr:hypothetical protein [Stieleria varia]TWU02706.1 hypothetical protein Pla52n_37650 [Stieleria varia]
MSCPHKVLCPCLLIDSIEKHETRVWIYRHSEADDSIVGFASLSATGWLRWPPPNGKKSRLLYIPQLGLDHKYRGKPSSPEYRYSNQIIEHLIGQAKRVAGQIREDKPPKKHVELLTLRVRLRVTRVRASRKVGTNNGGPLAIDGTC